jgi:hypothetical protein
VRIHYRVPTPSASGPELARRPVRSPVQVIVYDGDRPTVIEGTTSTSSDGVTVIEVPVAQAPTPGTPVQIIVYPPHAHPTVIEGTIYDSGDPQVIGIDVAR